MKTSTTTNPILSLAKTYIRLCLRSWKLFAASILICVGLAGFYMWWKTPVVEVDAQLMLKSDDSGGGLMASELMRSFAFGDMLGMNSSTDNEVMVLQSHTVFLNTAKDMNLNIGYRERRKLIKWVPMYGTSPLRMVAPPMLSDTLKLPMLFDVKLLDSGAFDITLKVDKKEIWESDNVSLPATLETPYGPFALEKTDNYGLWEGEKLRISVCSYAAAAETYVKLVKIFAPSRKTDFITLSFNTTDAKFGESLLTHIINNYNKLGNDDKNSRNSSGLKLANDRLESLEREMAETEKRLETFKTANNLTDLEFDAQFLLSKTSEVQSQLVKARTENELLKLTLDFITDKDNEFKLIPDLTSSYSPGTTSDAANSQITKYNELILERMKILKSASETNSAIKLLDEQITAMRQNIIVAVRRAYENSKVTLNDIQKENAKLDTRIGQLPSLEREYIEIKRIAELQNQMYIFLLQQKEEYSLNMASRTFSAVTIDAPHALVEAPGFTKKMILLLALVLGMMLPALYLLRFGMKGTAVSNAATISKDTDAPIIGELTSDGSHERLAVTANDNPNSESLRQLRAELTMILEDSKGNTALVTSANGGEGKTTLAVNLAGAYALLGKRVLLIDGDLRNGADAALLGIQGKPTLATYIAKGSEPAAQTVEIAPGSILHVLTAAPSSLHPSDVIGAEKTAELMSRLKKEYDVIIIDGTSFKDYSDTYYWAPMADVSLIVMRKGVSTAADVEIVDRLYGEGRLPRIAIVTNEL